MSLDKILMLVVSPCVIAKTKTMKDARHSIPDFACRQRLRGNDGAMSDHSSFLQCISVSIIPPGGKML